VPDARNGSNFGAHSELEKLKAASPFLIDIRTAGEVIPALGTHDFLHAGPRRLRAGTKPVVRCAAR